MQAGPGTSPWVHRRSLSSPITSTSIPDRFDAPGTKVPGSHPDTNELKSARDAYRLDCLASDRVSRTHPRCDCAHRDREPQDLPITSCQRPALSPLTATVTTVMPPPPAPAARDPLRTRPGISRIPDQGGASRRRWPGVSGGLSLGRAARRAPGHTPHVTRLRLAHMAGRRDPGSAVFLSSRPSGSRPPRPPRLGRLGQSSGPSLRDGFASPDPASAYQEIGACDEDGEIRRRRAGRR